MKRKRLGVRHSDQGSRSMRKVYSGNSGRSTTQRPQRRTIWRVFRVGRQSEDSAKSEHSATCSQGDHKQGAYRKATVNLAHPPALSDIAGIGRPAGNPRQRRFCLARPAGCQNTEHYMINPNRIAPWPEQAQGPVSMARASPYTRHCQHRDAHSAQHPTQASLA